MGDNKSGFVSGFVKRVKARLEDLKKIFINTLLATGPSLAEAKLGPLPKALFNLQVSL